MLSVKGIGSDPLLPGVCVGHAQDVEGTTGCTVVVMRNGAIAGVDVRGGAPGTRETDLLNPLNTVEKVHAVLLAGGSAFGLDAATGIMRYLEAEGVGFDTHFAKVPIVVGAVLYDLGIGLSNIRPNADMGFRACQLATDAIPATGSVGAGTGATVGKLAGPQRATKSGIGWARQQWGPVVVEALVAVNAVGEVVGEDGRVIAGIRSDQPGTYLRSRDVLRAAASQVGDAGSRVGRAGEGGSGATESGDVGRAGEGGSGDGISTNTTIGCLWTNARLTKAQASKVAQMSHDGLARTIVPIHTPHDGDTMFAVSVGDVAAELTVVGVLAAEVTAAAVRQAVQSATDLAGVPAAASWGR